MKKEQEKVLVVAQEIHFAKALAANDKQLRERALRRLGKWLSLKAKSSLDFTEEGFMRIWKGLFYCVWMSDKPLVQETTVETISHLLHCFIKFEDSLKFMSCFYQALSQAWFGLDQHRLDKYMMLVRRFVRQSFVVMKNSKWNEDNLREFGDMFFKALTVAPVGFVMHLADVYIVELSKVGDGKLSSKVVVALVKPWAHLLATQSDIRVINAVKRHVFLYLIRQTDVAIKHNAKFNAWKHSGFPGGDIELMEEVENSSDSDIPMSESEEEEEFLDPRAGRADTVLPPVEFKPSDIVNLLNVTKISQQRTLAARQSKSFTSLIDKFQELEMDKYPLGIKQVEHPEDSSSDDEVDKAIERLSNFERDLLDDSGRVSKKRKIKRDSVSSWDVSDEHKGGIHLTLSPHSLASSPWTVNNVEENGDVKEGVKNKKRKLSNGLTTPLSSKANSPTSKLIVEHDEVSTPTTSADSTKKSKVKKQNGDILLTRITPTTSVIHVKVTDEASTPTTSVSSTKKSKVKKQNGDISLTRITPSTSKLHDKKSLKTPGSEKKVLFALSKNKAQEPEEYMRSLESSPHIPFDASKKPLHGVLKPSPFTSPIDPFYMRKINRINKKKSL